MSCGTTGPAQRIVPTRNTGVAGDGNAHVSEVLALVRRAKTEAKLSQRATVDELIVTGPPEALAAIEACRNDLSEAGGIKEFIVADGPALVAEVRLTPA